MEELIFNLADTHLFFNEIEVHVKLKFNEDTKISNIKYALL